MQLNKNTTQLHANHKTKNIKPLYVFTTITIWVQLYLFASCLFYVVVVSPCTVRSSWKCWHAHPVSWKLWRWKCHLALSMTFHVCQRLVLTTPPRNPVFQVKTLQIHNDIVWESIQVSGCKKPWPLENDRSIREDVRLHGVVWASQPRHCCAPL